MKIPLEDFFEDIVGKAQRGLKLDDAAVAQRSGVSISQLEELKGGRGDPSLIPPVAEALSLHPSALVDSYGKNWYPENVPAVDGLRQFNSDVLGMTVNAYLVWDPDSREAAVFDTGVDETKLLSAVQELGLTVKNIFLTHTHGDHVALLGEIARATGASVLGPEREREKAGNAKPVHDGDSFNLGKLKIEARLTNGHSPGGTSYIISGLEVPVAIVGDSLFAGSMGGAPNDFELALRNNREKILTLPPETVIGPGHGPLTTVANELAHNPFYAEG